MIRDISDARPLNQNSCDQFAVWDTLLSIKSALAWQVAQCKIHDVHVSEALSKFLFDVQIAQPDKEIVTITLRASCRSSNGKDVTYYISLW